MTTNISEAEFKKLCNDIYADRDVIFEHNPMGTRDETLLWMLMSCLISYLSLDDKETPCFPGVPDAGTYKNAVLFILRDRQSKDFQAEPYLDKLIK